MHLHSYNKIKQYFNGTVYQLITKRAITLQPHAQPFIK